MFAFILLYFFDLLSLQRQHPLPWSESELTIPGTKVPGNIRSREQKFPGAKVPGNFRSWKRRFPLGTRSEQRKYRGAKSPDTSLTLITCRYVTSTRYVLLCHWPSRQWGPLNFGRVRMLSAFGKRCYRLHKHAFQCLALTFSDVSGGNRWRHYFFE